MKRQSILFILLLLLSLLLCCGCSGGSSADTARSDSSPPPPEARKESLETAEELPNLPQEISAGEGDAVGIPDHDKTENVEGIFEGLEGNHTAVFSFDGVETAFHFEDPAVQDVLFEAVVGSSYILSYYFDPSIGLYTIYEINES